MCKRVKDLPKSIRLRFALKIFSFLILFFFNVWGETSNLCFILGLVGYVKMIFQHLDSSLA